MTGRGHRKAFFAMLGMLFLDLGGSYSVITL